jgi:hypothetical protein
MLILAAPLGLPKFLSNFPIKKPFQKKGFEKLEA